MGDQSHNLGRLNEVAHLSDIADSFYGKRKRVDGVVMLGWHAIDKLRQDVDLKYLPRGPRRVGTAAKVRWQGQSPRTQPETFPARR